MIGSTVRAPSKLDIASAEGSIRVWVDSKGMGEGSEGDASFPTVVLSAEELRIACQIHEGGLWQAVNNLAEHVEHDVRRWRFGLELSRLCTTS